MHIAPRHIIQVGIAADAAGFLVMRHSLHVHAPDGFGAWLGHSRRDYDFRARHKPCQRRGRKHGHPAALKASISKAAEARISAIEFGGGDLIQGSTLSQPMKGELTSLSNHATVDAGRTVLAYGSMLVLSALLVSMRLPRTNTIENERLAA